MRDKIVDGIIAAGNLPHYRELSEGEYIKELKKKLLEEAQELPTVEDKLELLKELADIQEVLDNLSYTLKVPKVEMQKLQTDKNEKNGSFKKRLFVDYVETKDDSEWIEYYLKSPDKYPEIKD